MYEVLVADDEAEIRQLLRLYLEKDNYVVWEAEDGIQAMEMMKTHHISLLLLDIMMPKLDGYHVLQELRKEYNIPVIIISAKVNDNDRILGLDLGADDYLVKPFNPMEALARVNSNIRRFYALGGSEQESDSKENLMVKDLSLDVDACVLYRNDSVIELTSVEYRIMKLFMSSPGKVFTKQQIFEAGWNQDYCVDDNSIMVCISKLRGKLSDDNNAYIKTIRGLGYRMEK